VLCLLTGLCLFTVGLSKRNILFVAESSNVPRLYFSFRSISINLNFNRVFTLRKVLHKERLFGTKDARLFVGVYKTFSVWTADESAVI